MHKEKTMQDKYIGGTRCQVPDRQKGKSVGIALLIALFFVGAFDRPSQASCCRGVPRGEDAFKNAKVVFMGKVMSIKVLTKPNEPIPDERVYFAVQKSWKGAPGQKISLTTSTDPAGCGFHFDKNQSYIVFAHDENGLNSLNTDLCDPNVEAESLQGKELIKQLQAWSGK
jgi:hypothetical protein